VNGRGLWTGELFSSRSLTVTITTVRYGELGLSQHLPPRDLESIVKHKSARRVAGVAIVLPLTTTAALGQLGTLSPAYAAEYPPCEGPCFYPPQSGFDITVTGANPGPTSGST